MIERIEVSNFRSIGPDQILELGPLTALVGTNASGKSSLLKAFTFMADTLRLGLEGAVDTAGGHGSRSALGTDPPSAYAPWNQGRGTIRAYICLLQIQLRTCIR